MSHLARPSRDRNLRGRPMSIISEGALISVIGMGLVFVVLTLMMFLMLAVERVFRADEPAQGSSPAERERADPSESLRNGVGSERLAEVGAIALAIAVYMQERGGRFGTSISIDGQEYEVEMKDASRGALEVVVNGEGFRGVVGKHTQSFRSSRRLLGKTQARSLEDARRWRMAYPFAQGSYWPRGAWSHRNRTGRQGT